MIFDTFKDMIRRLFRRGTDKSDSDEREHTDDVKNYLRTSGINLTAVTAKRLATMTVMDSSLIVGGENKRSAYIGGVMAELWANARKITALAYGTGGCALVPYVEGGKIYTSIIPKDRFFITKSQGTDIVGATIIADICRKNSSRYVRLTEYTLENGSCIIRNRAAKDGSPCDLAMIDKWADIREEIRIGNVNRLLLAYLRNPCGHEQVDDLYGVPLTRGAEDLITQAEECINQVKKEFKHKSIKVFADSSLFDENDRLNTEVYKKTRNAGAISGPNATGAFFEVFDPAFRDTSLYNRLNQLFSEIEIFIGVDRGVLTDPVSEYSTATGIRRSNVNTFAQISAMRKQWEKAAAELAYTYDVFCNAFGLVPPGDQTVQFDWDYSLIESSAEAWQQLKEAKTMGAVRTAELRNFIYSSETMEESQRAVEEIAASEPSLSTLLGE